MWIQCVLKIASHTLSIQEVWKLQTSMRICVHVEESAESCCVDIYSKSWGRRCSLGRVSGVICEQPLGSAEYEPYLISGNTDFMVSRFSSRKSSSHTASVRLHRSQMLMWVFAYRFCRLILSLWVGLTGFDLHRDVFQSVWLCGRLCMSGPEWTGPSVHMIDTTHTHISTQDSATHFFFIGPLLLSSWSNDKWIGTALHQNSVAFLCKWKTSLH